MACLSHSPIIWPINFCNHIIFNHPVCVCVNPSDICISTQVWPHIKSSSMTVIAHWIFHSYLMLHITHCKLQRHETTVYLRWCKKETDFVCSTSSMAARRCSNTSFGNCICNTGYCNWLFHLTLQDTPKNITTWQSCVLKPCVVQCTSNCPLKYMHAPCHQHIGQENCGEIKSQHNKMFSSIKYLRK